MIITHKIGWQKCLSHQIWPAIEKGWKDDPDDFDESDHLMLKLIHEAYAKYRDRLMGWNYASVRPLP